MFEETIAKAEIFGILLWILACFLCIYAGWVWRGVADAIVERRKKKEMRCL